MSERLIEKLDRFGAEAGIKEMTPEIRRFAMLVRNDMLQVHEVLGRAVAGHRSSVHAVTEDIVFTVKMASFYPIKTDALVKEFSEWLAQKGKEQNFIVWRVAIEGASKEYGT